MIDNNNIYIRLQIEIRDAWKWIRAINWNENGFDFYDENNIEYSRALCRKGPNTFEGNLEKVCNYNEAELCEINLNSQLYSELKKMVQRDEIYDRIINLIHEQGRIEEKKNILFALHRHNTDYNAPLSSELKKSEVTLYHYRIATESGKWADIVQYAREASSVVQALDNAGKGFSYMAHIKKEIGEK